MLWGEWGGSETPQLQWLQNSSETKLLKLSSSRTVRLHLVFPSAQITVHTSSFIKYEERAMHFYN